MGNRLLLADDSITIQKVVGIIFANEDLFDLTVVDNGTAALEKAREIHPDVMLVDALMPGKSGYEVCQEVRRDPVLGNTPLLLLIGAFDPVDEEKTRQCGADASITKPFESQQLIDRVKELLEVGRQRQAAAPVTPAAAPAAPPAAAPAPEDIWGELAAETVAPVSAPAAAQAQPATPTPAPARPAAPAAAPAFEEIEEATIEDDLWGAFELVEEVEEEEPAVAAPAAPAPPERPAPVEEFVAPPPAAAPAAAPAPQPAGEYEVEEFFTFEEDTEGVEETEPVEEVLAEGFAFEEPEPFTFEEAAAEPEVADTFAQVAPEPFVAAAEEAVPVAAPQAAPAAAPEARPAPAAEITEEALVAALSKVSREVVERIVWEVVPDLAEALIREEIRKIKAGSQE